MPINLPPIALDRHLTMSTAAEAAPIVGNPTLKPMSEAQAAPKRIAGKILLMDENAQPAPRGAIMDPVPTRVPIVKAKPDREQGEALQAAAEELGSVRLRLRVDRGRISVIGA